ncbi:hypothetical protein PISL3812_09478 [Talaromyces islandicus]|uniref:Zn(2)-C6 fungal-type domain-containing protein n=1 Tax=Talaromyces islandicus TaxID=28573 RepID=A0A0U1MA50_TALIS|nr:hypothetical protein PISL3812_09478 [Talaromyces islandicus]
MPNISVGKRALLGRPCLTCQHRKIKCDRGKPTCERCNKAGFKCDGYPVEPFVHVVPTPRNGESNKITLKRVRNGKNNPVLTEQKREKAPEKLQLKNATVNINMAPENRMQVLSYFLERYMPASVISYRTFETPSAWIKGLPNLLGRWEILDTALTALCLAYIGDLHQDKAHLQESQRFYSLVLRKMGSLPLESIKSANQGVLATTMIMAMYELRGPPSQEIPLNLSLYSRIRTTAVWDAYGTRKSLFLAQPEWQGLSETPHDHLLDLLVFIPGLLEKSDRVITTGDESRGINKVDLFLVNDLLGCWLAVHHRLTNWYFEFDAQESEGLFKTGPLKPNSHPYLEGNTELHAVFPQVISFKDTYIAQVMLLYWFGQVIVHTATTKLYGIREKHKASINAKYVPQNYKKVHNETMQDAEKMGEYYATKICQSIASLKGGYGFQIAMVPVWAAQQFFHVSGDAKKFLWCREVLKGFGKVGGFVLAAALGILTPKQYPGLTTRV